MNQSIKIQESDVITSYKMILGRVPESKQVIEQHQKSSSVLELINTLLSSPEYSRIVKFNDRFRHYNSFLDIPKIIESYIAKDRNTVEDSLVNFLGVAIPTKIMSSLKGREGTLDNIPIPANFHADMAEWAGVLRTIDTATENYKMIELGCGWGCWMNNAGIAAKMKNLPVTLMGIEADDLHLKFANETLLMNGFKDDEFQLSKELQQALMEQRCFQKERMGIFGEVSP